MAQARKRSQRGAPESQAEASPRVVVEVPPSVPAPTVYDRVSTVRAIISGLYYGDLSAASLLVDQMWQNPRLRVAMATRLAGLTGAEVRWHPSSRSRDAKAAAKAMERDWSRMAPTASRKQVCKWGLMLGPGFAQTAWFLDEATGRYIPRLQPWHPYGSEWNDNLGTYRIRPYNGSWKDVAAPALVEDSQLTPGWVVHEAFGGYSHREGYALSAWYAWLGNELGRRDMLRVSEKVGQGIVLLYVPHGASKQAARDFRDGWRNMGGGAAVPCEELDDGRKFDAKPFEWNAQNGYQVVDSTLANTAADLVILFLGGNLQTEVKGGGSYAAVIGQSEVRSDYIDDDARTETDTLERQLFRPWATVNFGDPDAAPIREVVTDPPSKDAAAAGMAAQLAQALDNLARHGVDTRALAERFRLPMALEGRDSETVPVQVEGAPVPDAAPMPMPDAAPEQAPAADAAPTNGAPVADPKIALTATDIAAIVRVDEARQDLGLDPAGGDVGWRWVVEHSARIKADAAPQIAEVAKAEAGKAPGEQSLSPDAPPEASPESDDDDETESEPTP